MLQLIHFRLLDLYCRFPDVYSFLDSSDPVDGSRALQKDGGRLALLGI